MESRYDSKLVSSMNNQFSCCLDDGEEAYKPPPEIVQI